MCCGMMLRLCVHMCLCLCVCLSVPMSSSCRPDCGAANSGTGHSSSSTCDCKSTVTHTRRTRSATDWHLHASLLLRVRVHCGVCMCCTHLGFLPPPLLPLPDAEPSECSVFLSQRAEMSLRHPPCPAHTQKHMHINTPATGQPQHRHAHQPCHVMCVSVSRPVPLTSARRPSCGSGCDASS